MAAVRNRQNSPRGTQQKLTGAFWRAAVSGPVQASSEAREARGRGAGHARRSAAMAEQVGRGRPGVTAAGAMTRQPEEPREMRSRAARDTAADAGVMAKERPMEAADQEGTRSEAVSQQPGVAGEEAPGGGLQRGGNQLGGGGTTSGDNGTSRRSLRG